MGDPQWAASRSELSFHLGKLGEIWWSCEKSVRSSVSSAQLRTKHMGFSMDVGS